MKIYTDHEVIDDSPMTKDEFCSFMENMAHHNIVLTTENGEQRQIKISVFMKGMMKRMDNEELTEIKEDMCDNYCKYPSEIADDSVLRVICNKCPLNRLEGDE